MKVLDVLRQIPSNVDFFSVLFLGVCVVLDIVIQVGQKLFKCSTAVANHKCFLSPSLRQHKNSGKMFKNFHQQLDVFSVMVQRLA